MGRRGLAAGGRLSGAAGAAGDRLHPRRRRRLRRALDERSLRARRSARSVVVENKPGNGSSIAADLVAKSPPDGYTLLIASPSSISVNPALNPKLTYSPSDLVPIARITTSPLVLAVHPGTGIRTRGRAGRGGEEGTGQAQLLDTRATARRRTWAPRCSPSRPATQMTHVPYRGGAPDDPGGHGRRHSSDLRYLAHGAAASQQRPAAGDRCQHPGALAAGARPAWHAARPASRSTTSSSGTACSRPRPRRRPSSRKIYDATAAAMQRALGSGRRWRARGPRCRCRPSPEKFAEFLVEDGKFWGDLVEDAKVTLE